jgi:predicted RNA-binding protein YlxR (DUF448 family)
MAEALRTCIGTGNKFPKNEMIRFVANEHGLIRIDPKGKEKGRGANLSMSMEAFDQAVKKHAFERALKLNRKLDAAKLQGLRAEFAEAIDQKKFRPGNKPVTIKVKKEQLEKITHD